jgi:hypothetical protein
MAMKQMHYHVTLTAWQSEKSESLRWTEGLGCFKSLNFPSLLAEETESLLRRIPGQLTDCGYLVIRASAETLVIYCGSVRRLSANEITALTRKAMEDQLARHGAAA